MPQPSHIPVKNILILFAHPAFQKSRVNTRLSVGLADIEGVTVHDLYQAYPEFDIDVPHEQELVEQHDIIIFHHPLFWYSTPAILKEWQDLVLEHGWAYGSQGNALRNKVFFNIITAGGGAQAYTPEGYNGRTLRALLAPLEQTSRLCKMRFLPPYVVYGTHAIEMDAVQDYHGKLHQLLIDLRDEKFGIEQAQELAYLNDYLTLAKSGAA